jgi:hypothetical protein
MVHCIGFIDIAGLIVDHDFPIGLFRTTWNMHVIMCLEMTEITLAKITGSGVTFASFLAV